MNIDMTGLRSSSVYAEEALVVDLQSLLHTVMIEKGMTRSQLAQAMGVSKARITQLFSSDCENFTVRLLARALHALGDRLEVSSKTYQEVRRRADMIEQFEEAVRGFADCPVSWEMPANDFRPEQVARPDGRRANTLIARSLQRTTDYRRAA